ncbi:MAG: transketolase [Oscillospiraceae bacterium]|nr:transketolase [Oscillospiraceae bacterium]
MTNKELAALAYELRKKTVDVIVGAKAGHIGGDMSVMDTLVMLYFKHMNISPANQDDPNRDKFVLSKGHSVESYYTVLAEKGFFDYETYKNTFSRYGSEFIGHPHNSLPGVEMNSGSLGHGLPVCVGMALAGKMDKAPYRVYTVMGDGELAEGSVWEGAMAAGHYHLDNLCAVVDRNGLQISGTTEDVMSHEPLSERFAAFGWHVIECDGNDMDALDAAFTEAKETKGQPSVVIAHTVKGCGSPVMENKAPWHHKVPNAEEYTQIENDLTARKEALEHA